MLLYSIIMITAIILAFASDRIKGVRQKRAMEILMLVILVLLSGLRSDFINSDDVVYKNIYNYIPTITELDLSSKTLEIATLGMEKGYIVYNSLFKTIGLSFYGFTLVNSAIFYFGMYFILRKRFDNFNLFLVFFIYKMMFFDTFVSLRQPIAMLIFWYSIKFVEQRKFWKYLICCVGACLFHSTALILFVVYFLYNVKFTKRCVILIGLIGLAFLLLNITGIFIFNPVNILSNIFETGVNNLKVEVYFGNTGSVSLLNIVELYVIIYIIIKRYDKVVSSKNDIALVSIIMLIPIFTIFRSFEIVSRFKDYFIIFYIVILERFMKDKQGMKIMIITLLSVICMLGYTRYISIFGNGVFTKYRTFIEDGYSIFIGK